MTTAVPGVAKAKATQLSAQSAGWYPLNRPEKGGTAVDHRAGQGAVAGEAIMARREPSAESANGRHVFGVESYGSLRYKIATAVGIVGETRAIQQIAESAG